VGNLSTPKAAKEKQATWLCVPGALGHRRKEALKEYFGFRRGEMSQNQDRSTSLESLAYNLYSKNLKGGKIEDDGNRIETDNRWKDENNKGSGNTDLYHLPHESI
jgi:hypothetical protein